MTRTTENPVSAADMEAYAQQVNDLSLPHILAFREIAEHDMHLTMSVILTVTGNSITSIFPKTNRDAPARALRDLASKLESGEIDALLTGKGGRA